MQTRFEQTDEELRNDSCMEKEAAMTRKGSITIYLSLVLCVIVSLIFTVMDSARCSGGRAMALMAADEALFSVFGEYDRILYRDYGLLVLDGGYESGSFKAGLLLEEAADVMEKVISPGSGIGGAFSSNLFTVSLKEKAITGYTLATDEKGEALRAQIHDLMIKKLGTDMVSALAEKYTEASSIGESAESGKEEDMERMKEVYEAQKQAAREERAAQAAREAENGDDANEPAQNPPAVPSDFKNPIDNIYKLKKLGIMAWAVPDVNQVSGYRINRGSMLSKRKLAQGMGLIRKFNAGAEDRFLLARYITDFFPCYTDAYAGEFAYQTEYAVAGKSTDVENLKGTLNRLLLIREGMNYSYLILDEQKSAEAAALAAIISSVILLPQAMEAVKQILLLCWAYGESMLDLKNLLSGGKVPMMKSADTWQLDLSDLAWLSGSTQPADSGKGFNYKEYLCILLMMGSSTSVMSKITDLLEYNRRLKGGSGFSLDTCICSMEIEVRGNIGDHEYTLTRNFSYASAG